MPLIGFEGTVAPQQTGIENGNQPTDLSSWVAQNQAYPVPGAALGLGAGNFLQDQDLLFTQDSFWSVKRIWIVLRADKSYHRKAILEGTQAPSNGMV